MTAAVCRAVSLDAVAEMDLAAAAADGRETMTQSSNFLEEVRIVQADRAAADLVRRATIGEAMTASWMSSDLWRMVTVTERNVLVELASHAGVYLPKYVCALDSLVATTQTAVDLPEDEDVAVSVVVGEEEAVVAQLVEHMHDFGTREQRYRCPWIHSDEAMPIDGSPKVGMRPHVNWSMMSVVGHHLAFDVATAEHVVR